MWVLENAINWVHFCIVGRHLCYLDSKRGSDVTLDKDVRQGRSGQQQQLHRNGRKWLFTFRFGNRLTGPHSAIHVWAPAWFIFKRKPFKWRTRGQQWNGARGRPKPNQKRQAWRSTAKWVSAFTPAKNQTGRNESYLVMFLIRVPDTKKTGWARLSSSNVIIISKSAHTKKWKFQIYLPGCPLNIHFLKENTFLLSGHYKTVSQPHHSRLPTRNHAASTSSLSLLSPCQRRTFHWFAAPSWHVRFFVVEFFSRIV